MMSKIIRLALTALVLIVARGGIEIVYRIVLVIWR